MTPPLPAPAVRPKLTLASPLVVFVPGKLTNPLNGSFSRAHWSRKSKWANEWKDKTIAAWRIHVGAALPDLRAPKAITFVACVGQFWDSDAIAPGIKPIRDALIGYAIHSDAWESGHDFTYYQESGHRQPRGVRITITAKEL